MFLCVCMGFGPISLCVQTVWTSIRDLAFIGGQRLFNTRR